MDETGPNGILITAQILPRRVFFLLETRVNADELRRDSGDDAADNYIAGFEDYIRKFDPELAAEIL